MAGLPGVSGSNLFKMLCQSVEKDQDKIMSDAAFRKEIETSFMEIAELLQVRLFKVESPFWAIALMGVVKNIDWKQRGFIDLKIGRPILMTFNPMFIPVSLKNDEGEYDIRVFIGYIVSELMRLIYLHPETFGSRNKFNDRVNHSRLERASDANVSELMKSAANAKINDIRVSVSVTEDGKFASREDTTKIILPSSITSKDQLAAMASKNLDKEETIEYYYHAQKDMPEDEGDGGGAAAGNGEGGDPNGIATPNNSNGQPVHNWENTGFSSDDQTAIIKEFLQSLSEKTRGMAPSGVSSDIERLLRAPERSYKDLFADMVQASEVSDYEPTRMRRNRRFPERLDLFGKRAIGHHHVYVAVDTSGSTRDVVANFIVEILQICREAESTVTIIECDATIQKVYDLERAEDFDYKMRGWGGTVFRPVIEFVNGDPEFMKTCPEEFKKFWRPPEESVLCFFTDGYGESEIPKPKCQKVLWVVSSGAEHLSVQKPYGTVVGILEGKRK